MILRFGLVLAAACGLLYAFQTRATQRSFTDWRQFLGGSDSAQYSALKQIDKTNVSQLQVVWSYPTGGMNQYLFSPTVVDNVMYVQAKNNSLVALDAATGKELWAHPFQGAVTTRGINYWQSADGADRRLFTTNAGFLTAINARTGETIQTFGDNGRTDLRSGMDDPTSVTARLSRPTTPAAFSRT